MKRGLPKESTSIAGPRRSGDLQDHFLNNLLPGRASQANVPVDNIRANPNQPRKDPGDLTELTDSVREKGILEPLIVRRIDTGYEIIAGERRFIAFLRSGRREREVPCVVVEADDRQALEISLVENLQRKDLDIWEEAETFARMSRELGYTQEEIARRIGKSIGYVNGRMGVSALPTETKEVFSNFENAPQDLVLQAVRARRAGKLEEYNEMVENGEIASVKEARKKVDKMRRKRQGPSEAWTSFPNGEYRIVRDRKGGFLITIRCHDERVCQDLTCYLQGGPSSESEASENSATEGGEYETLQS